MIKCPKCNDYVLVRERGDHTAFMSRIIVKSDGGIDIDCPNCHSQVPMPGAMKVRLGLLLRLLKTGA